MTALISNYAPFRGSRLTVPGSIADVRNTYFGNGQSGLWFDTWDLWSAYTDDARTSLVTASGDAVASVTDQSGNGYHAEQDVSGDRPLFKREDGYSFLEFASGDHLDVPGTFTDTKRTLVMAGRVTGGDERKCLIEGYGSAQAYEFLTLEIDDNPGTSGNFTSAIDLAGTVSDPSEYVLGTDFIVSLGFDRIDDATDAAAYLRVNGSTVYSGSVNPVNATSTPAGVRIFANRDTSRFAAGRLYGLCWIHDYIADPSAIEAAFATICPVTLP